MLPLLLCSLLLTPRHSINLSPVWRGEELHIAELLPSASATSSPFPYSLSFLRSLYPDINPSQPSRHTVCPHLSYCYHILVFQSHTSQLVLLLVYQAVSICVQELQKCLLTLLSSVPKALFLPSHCPMCLLSPISTFSFTCKLSSSFSVYLVYNSLQQTSKTGNKDAFRPLLSSELHLLLAVLIPQRETCGYKSQDTTRATRQLLTHIVYPLLPEPCSFSRTERNTTWPSMSLSLSPDYCSLS